MTPWKEPGRRGPGLRSGRRGAGCRTAYPSVVAAGASDPAAGGAWSRSCSYKARPARSHAPLGRLAATFGSYGGHFRISTGARRDLRHMAPCAGRCRAHCPHRLAGRARAALLRAADAQRVSGGAAVRAGGGGLRISAWRERVVSTHPSLFRRAPGVFEGGLSECPLLGGRRADADLCAGLRRLRLQPRPCPYPPRSETRSHRNAHLFFICPRQNARDGT